MSDQRPEPARAPLPPQPVDAYDREGRRTTVNWTTVVVVALVGAVVTVILILHLTGVVSPAGHG